MEWLTDRHKINIFADPIGGCTAVRYTQYYDMLGMESIDFVVSANIAGASDGTTAMQNVFAQIYRATGSTGGGAAALSSATGVVAKTGTAITTVARGKCLDLAFTNAITLDIVGATITVLGQEFISATGNTAAYYFQTDGSDAATVTAAGFITAFNNTNCTLSSAWKAEMGQTSSGNARVFIRPRSETAVPSSYHVSAGGSTLCGIGIPAVGLHLSAKTEHLGDYRYVALGFSQLGASLVSNTAIHRQPLSITVIRALAGGTPALTTGTEIAYSKRLQATQL